MIVGFTGTRRGMTDAQGKRVCDLMRDTDDIHFARHGDCVGADAEFHEICWHCGVEVVLHPCTLHEQRAYCAGRHVMRTMDEKVPLDRNWDIICGSDVLLAAPAEFEEQRRSGTWSTVRRARVAGMLVLVVCPDGTVASSWDREDPSTRRRTK